MPTRPSGASSANSLPESNSKKIERFQFYDAAGTPDVCLTIATGDQRIYANLLLTIGVV